MDLQKNDNPGQPQSSKLPYLEGIRGLAALLVFAHHFLLAFYPAHYTFNPAESNLNNRDIQYGQSLLSFLTNGNFAVCIFFTLSGFVLSRQYLITNKFSLLTSGAGRRFLRLYIPVAASIIISFVLLRAGLYLNAEVAAITHSKWLGDLWHLEHPLRDLLRCLAYGTMLKGDSSFNTVLWSLSTELYGSLLVFAFLALSHNTKNRLAMLATAVLCCILTDNFYIAAFLLGISLSYTEMRMVQRDKYVLAAASLLLIVVGLCLGSCPTNFKTDHTFFEGKYFTRQYPYQYHVAGAYMVILAVVLSKKLQAVLGMRLFAFLGRISFSLYLLHALVIGTLGCSLFLRWHERYGFNRAVLYIGLITVPACLLLSYVMTRWIDEPGTRFAKKMYERYSKKEATIEL